MMARIIFDRILDLRAEAVAYAENGLDIVRFRWIWFDLCSQVADVDVDRAFDTLEGCTLQLDQQVGTREYMSRRGHQYGQQVKFGGRQVYGVAVDADDVGIPLERYGIHFQAIRQWRS